MRAFEIHTFHNGKWKIDSVFDDRDLALFEAGRMESSSRHAGGRVIEENYDEDTQECSTRTIYRGANDMQCKTAPKTKVRQDSRSGAPAKKLGREPDRKKRAKKSKNKKKKGIGFSIMILALALFGGVAAIVGLRLLAEFI